MMAHGMLAIVLHAHLPFVRHPEAPSYMEESWLFEAITETYAPLLLMFERLLRDDVDFRLTISLSPTLLSMLSDDLLKERYAKRIDDLIALSEREVARTQGDSRFHHLAQMYLARFSEVRNLWRANEGDLIRAFKRFQDAGKIEIITCTATHPFIPLMDRNWASIRAQVRVAADVYEDHFGCRTPGIWLGECGYVPGVDELLREEGIRYFFVDTHGILFAEQRPAYGVHAPVFCHTGVAAFGRDVQSSKQVWSSRGGYPGDPCYRDFYRDIGFDLSPDEVGKALQPDGIRTYTGIKYHSITHASLDNKNPYCPHTAWQRAAEHAEHFLRCRVDQVRHLRNQMDRNPIIVAPYDAELFGHWWYEGPMFLEMLFRKMAADQGDLEPITPTAYLGQYPTNQVSTPATSSWGAGGFGEYWCNGTNAWIYPHLHKMGERMVELAQKFVTPSDLERRALNQAARELMLAQASDWAFIMRSGTTVSYATQRTNQHIKRFLRLYDDLMSQQVDDTVVGEIEGRDNLFPRIDYRVYAT